jgi:hypothetical protein
MKIYAYYKEAYNWKDNEVLEEIFIRKEIEPKKAQKVMEESEVEILGLSDDEGYGRRELLLALKEMSEKHED